MNTARLLKAAEALEGEIAETVEKKPHKFNMGL